jgi:transposase
MATVAKLIQRHPSNLVTYLRHRLTNAGLEGLNAVIQGIKKTAGEFRNAEHFKTAIYFHCGDLDFYTQQTR